MNLIYNIDYDHTELSFLPSSHTECWNRQLVRPLPCGLYGGGGPVLLVQYVVVTIDREWASAGQVHILLPVVQRNKNKSLLDQ